MQISTQILSFRVLRVFLEYIAAVVPGFLLPMGCALRIFPFTKKAGDTIIALSLGGLFMLPASLVVVGELYGLSAFEHVEAAKDQDFAGNVHEGIFGESSNALMSGVCQNTATKILFGFGELFWSLIYAIIVSFITFCFGCFFEYFNDFASYIWPWVLYSLQTFYASILTGVAEGIEAESIYSTTVLPIVNTLLPAVAELTMFSIISVVVVAIITFTGTKAISTAIGGEYTFYGLTKMI